MADQPLSRERAQNLAQAIKSGEPYDRAEAAALLEALAAQVAAHEARRRDTLTLVGGDQAQAAFALLARVPRAGT